MFWRRGKLNVCDDCGKMVTVVRQNKYCSDVVMCHGKKNEWLKKFQVSIIGPEILSHKPEIQMVCQSKYYLLGDPI